MVIYNFMRKSQIEFIELSINVIQNLMLGHNFLVNIIMTYKNASNTGTPIHKVILISTNRIT